MSRPVRLGRSFQEIGGLKIRRNVVTIEYVDDREGTRAYCYFDKEPDRKCFLSFADCCKAIKRRDVTMPTSVGALTQYEGALEAKAQLLPSYPVDALKTTLGDVNP